MERTAGKELALVRRGWGSPDPHVPGVPPQFRNSRHPPRFLIFLQNGCSLESPFGNSEFLTP